MIPGFLLALQTAAATGLTVMSFNVRRSDLYGWDEDGSSWYNFEAVDGNDETHGSHWQRVARGDAVAQSIVDADADIVGLQEYAHSHDGNDTDIVRRLELLTGETWYYAYPEGRGNPVVSRFPVVSVGDNGVQVEVASDLRVWVFSRHFGLGSNWNQAYIPYAAYYDYSEAEIVAFVELWDNWGSSMDALLPEVAAALASGEPVFFTGDFNEPSHLDWTEAAAAAGYIPLAVDAPLSHVFIDDLGMIDGYHQDRVQDGEDEVSRWGYTWTSDGAASYDDDRIDFVYYAGDGVEVVDSVLVGDANGGGVRGSEDVDLKAWWDSSDYYTVSDHRAIAVRFELRDPDLPEDTGTPNDTGAAVDTGEPTDTGSTSGDTGSNVPSSPGPGDADSDDISACGCGGGTGSGPFSLALLAAAARRRRGSATAPRLMRPILWMRYWRWGR